MSIPEAKLQENQSESNVKLSKSKEQEPIIFQVIDWVQYSEIEESTNDNYYKNSKNAESDDTDELEAELDMITEQNKFTKYKIRLYGRTQDNKSVVINVNNYTPFFYIKVPNDWTDTKIYKLMGYIKTKISNQNALKGFKSFEIMKKKDLYGFTGYKEFKFVRLVFHNMKSYKAFEYWIGNNKIKNSMLSEHPFKIQLYESNIEPFIRCMHIRGLSACGWIRVSKYQKYASSYSYCGISAQTDWTNLEHYECNSIQKFVIASYDIECSSASGNFPQAIDPDDNKDLTDNTKPGDPVIQIGTVFTYYGESEPFYKKIITLKGCDKVKGLEDVDIESYEKEKDVLLAWSKLIQEKDPDIITGWNINGFDFKYMYDRARKLKILDKFSELSRIRGEKAEFKEKMLASSALGDNLLKFFDMGGRIVIDMMKERQREAKLDSYKLDFVASTYIKEKMVMCEMSENKSVIYTSGVYGIKSEDYVHITWDDGLSENKHDTKYKITKLEKITQTQLDDLVKKINLHDDISKYEFKKPKNLYMLELNGTIPEEIFQENNEKMWHYVNISNDKLDSESDKLNESGESDKSDKSDKLTKSTKSTKSTKKTKLKVSDKTSETKLYFQVEGHAHDEKENKNENNNSQRWIDMEMQDVQVPIKGNKIFWAHAKDDISPKELFALQKGSDADRGIIAKYCIMDCVLVSKLMDKLQVLNNNIGMANVCNVPLNYIFMRGQGVKIFSLVSKKCRELGFLIPKMSPQNQNNKNNKGKDSDDYDPNHPYKNFKKIKKRNADSDDELDDSDEEDAKVGYEGATVFPPVKGIHYEPIPVLDFASLYPRSMIYMNISHECYVINPIYDNLPDYIYKTATYNNNDGTTTTCRFAQKKDGTKGVLCIILEELLKKRSDTKKLMEKAKAEGNNFLAAIYDGLQLAYKVTANSLYGQVGAPTSPIYMKELAASTTATGRKMLEFSRDFIEGTFGELINLAIHNKEKYIKNSKDLYKDVPAKKFVEPKVGRNTMDDFINYFYDKVNMLLSPQYKVKPRVIYGDSVTPDTPIILLNELGQVEIKSIDNIGSIWTSYDAFKPDIVGLTNKEQDANINYKVWTDKGWANIKRVIRHKTNKKIYEILTHTGCVKVTEDHSLLDINCKQIKPENCVIGTELLHCIPVLNSNNETKMNLKKAFVYGFFFGDGSCGKYSSGSKVKYSWALNNKDMELNNKLFEMLQEIYPNDKFKILDTLESSGVYKIVPSCGNIKKFVDEYRNKFYDKDKFKILPLEILNGSISEKEEFLKGYYTADGCRAESLATNCHRFDIKGQISALNMYCLIVSLGYKVSINKRTDKPEIFTITYSSQDTLFRKNSNAIKKITDLGYVNDYVYDLETSVGHFHAGVGSLIVKNTDSVFFTPKIHNIKTKQIRIDRPALKVCIEIGMLAGDTICKILPEPEEQVYEKTLWPFIILTKKRYVGNLYEDDDSHYKQKSMGIVLKRRDNAKIVKIVVGGIVDYILNGKPGETKIEDRNKGAIEYTRTLLKKILRGEYPIDKYVVSKTLRSTYADRTRIVHAVLADRIGIRDPGNKPESNDRIPYVYIIPKGKVTLQGDRVEDPKYVLANNLELDYLFYITNQIMKPAKQFLEHIANNPDKLFEDYINKEINRRKKISSVTDFVTNEKNYKINKGDDEDDDKDEEDDDEEDDYDYNNNNAKQNYDKSKTKSEKIIQSEKIMQSNEDNNRLVNTIKTDGVKRALTISI